MFARYFGGGVCESRLHDGVNSPPALARVIEWPYPLDYDCHFKSPDVGADVGVKAGLRSYYDHVARREEDVVAILRYILANPVHRGLVTDPDPWPYSGLPEPLPG